MTRPRIDINPNLERDYLATQDAVDLSLEAAEEVADVAADIAPKRLEKLADSIEGVAGFVDGQALGRVNADDFKAHWIEFGTQTQPAQPYLRPAAERVLGAVTQGEDT